MFVYKIMRHRQHRAHGPLVRKMRKRKVRKVMVMLLYLCNTHRVTVMKVTTAKMHTPQIRRVYSICHQDSPSTYLLGSRVFSCVMWLTARLAIL